MRRHIEAAVFVGPSLAKEDLRQLPDSVEILPPAAQGDIYRLSQFAPKVIGLVDGFFHSMPAVWHKEVLWAMEQGAVVLGAASMGALRGAELACYGMQGIGSVFRMFDSGLLTDDDEVAILHGPAELGYVSLSNAMVDIRATVKRAYEQSVIDSECHDLLIRLAKKRPFWERSYATLFEDANLEGCHIGQGVRRWILENQIGLKRRDALMLIDRLAAVLDGSAEDAAPSNPIDFNYTTHWHRMRCQHLALDDTPFVGLCELLEELALKGPEYARSLELFPVPVPDDGVLGCERWTKAENPLEQRHDEWMRSLTRKLKDKGAYDALLDLALRKKKYLHQHGAFSPVSDYLALLQAHFQEIRDTPAWFTGTRSGADERGDVFWHELKIYSKALGMKSGQDFLNAVARDRQLRGV